VALAAHVTEGPRRPLPCRSVVIAPKRNDLEGRLLIALIRNDRRPMSGGSWLGAPSYGTMSGRRSGPVTITSPEASFGSRPVQRIRNA